MARLVGLRFLPTDYEILCHLENKRLDPDYSVHTITEAKIYQFEPFQLPALSPIQADENFCYFFCEPDYINADRSRVRRKTNTGYWKPTGKAREINAKCSSEVIGTKRILLYYEHGQGSEDIKTDWVMHQFSIKDNSLYEKDFVLCRIKRNKDKKARCFSNNIEGQRHKKRRISTSIEGQQHKVLRSSTIDEENISPTSHLLPSNYSISSGNFISEDTGIYISEDTSPEMQLVPQLLPSNYSISDSRNHVEEDTSPKSQLLSRLLSSNNMISHVTEHTPLKSQVVSQLLPINNMISNRNHVVENTSPELQLLLQSLRNNNSISDFRNHMAENTSPESQLVTQSLPSKNSISNSRNHDAENISPESQLVTQSLPSNNSISNSRNHVAENISMVLQLIPSNNSISDSRNHVAENTSSLLQLLLQLLLSNNSISNSRNHVAENISPESQLLSPELQLLLQLLLSNNSISNPRNHAGENTSPKLQLIQLLLQLLSQLLSSNNLVCDFINSRELQLLLSNCLISNRNHVAENTLHPMIFDAVNGFKGLDQPSFSAMQLPINTEQGYSYCSVSSNDYDVLNTTLGSDQEGGIVNPPRVVRDEYPSKVTGHHTHPTEFNPSKPVEGFCGGDSSDIDSKSFDEWVNDVFMYDTPCVNHN